MLGLECRRAVLQEPRARHSAMPGAAAQLVCWRRSSWQLHAGVDDPHTKRKISGRPFSTCRTNWPSEEAEHYLSYPAQKPLAYAVNTHSGCKGQLQCCDGPIAMLRRCGLSPCAGTPLLKRSVGTRRAPSMQDTLLEGTARATQLAPAAFTASAL
eukprot:scaffold106285_cov69-Phaeocystis_antarctica.AAC.2